MLLREAKRILNRNGYILVEQEHRGFQEYQGNDPHNDEEPVYTTSEFDAYETALIKKLETIEGVSKVEVNRDESYAVGDYKDTYHYTFRVNIYDTDEKERIATECEEIAKNSAKLYGSGATISRTDCDTNYDGFIDLSFEITIA